MGKTEAELHELPEGEDLACYRCKSARAVKYRWMRTPSGGKYKRGWCSPCLTGQEHNTPYERPSDLDDTAKAFKIGQPVAVGFEGKVLHYIPGRADTVMVLVGTACFEVPMSALEPA